MAVSGRKVSEFQGSHSQGSAEDFEQSCDSCLTEGHHVEASGYCMDCCEYLCINCFRYHRKTKASRNHQLLDKDNMPKHYSLPKPTDVCTEKCSIHGNEVIRYFCPKHEELGCTDCMTMNHGTCNLGYIPKISTGIGDSDEYREIVKQLDEKLNEADFVLKKASFKDREIDDSHDRAIKDFVKFRKELNDHLDTIQRKIEGETSKKAIASKEAVNAVVTSCTKISSEIKKVKSSLHDSKAANQNGQLFMDIKRAKSKLRSGEIQQAAALLEKTRTQFASIRNKDLEKILAVATFGKLTGKNEAVEESSKTLQSLATTPTEPSRTIQSLAVTPRGQGRTGMFSNLQQKTYINLGSDCQIMGCVVLSSGKLVLAEYSRLMVVNTEKNVLFEEKQLDSRPWDIAVLPQDQIAVSMPKKKQVLIMTTANKLSTVYSIKVKVDCYGIIYHQTCLYVLCGKPRSIHVLDMKGNIKDTISLDEAICDRPEYMVLSQDHSCLFISDCNNNSIVSVTLQGKVSAVYSHKHQDLNGPQGMLVLDDGSLLVCCWRNNTIHRVTADLKQGRKVLDGLSFPWSICYNADRSELYIGGYGCDKLTVCSVIYNK